MRREWNPTVPNRLWVADITYVRTWEGWLYLAAVLDCHSRRCVGWSLRDDPRAELVGEVRVKASDLPMTWGAQRPAHRRWVRTRSLSTALRRFAESTETTR